MAVMHSMKDMQRTDEEKQEMAIASMPGPSSQPDYPYGLCICLTDIEIDKLGLTDEELSPGDIIHFHALAKVTSYSENASEGQEPKCRAEMQITHMSAESEDEENDDTDNNLRDIESPGRRAARKLYEKTKNKTTKDHLDTENHPGRPAKINGLYGL